LSSVVEYWSHKFTCRRLSFVACRRCRLRSPLIRAMKASGTQWGSPLGVVAHPPLSKSSWRSWSASPLLLRGAWSPQPPPLRKWWPQEGAAPAVVAAEEAATVEAQEEVPAEAGLVDIASILGAPTVTIVRSSL
jgi:hypothetical protein